MRWTIKPSVEPMQGQRRTRTFFAWFPVRIGPVSEREHLDVEKRFVWLERVTVIEECHGWMDYTSGESFWKWFAIEETTP